ncbi:MAG: hypothetical protein JSV09_11760, partial [Thermoplasmata archaeon]
MKRIASFLVLIVTLFLFASLPHVEAGTVSALTEPPSDLGVIPIGGNATLEFAAEYPSDSNQSMAIILINYSNVGFTFNRYTMEMDSINVTDQFDVNDNTGVLMLNCSSIIPVNGTLNIELFFKSESVEGYYTFSWRYIYVAYMAPPYFPSTVDIDGETSASVVSIEYILTVNTVGSGSVALVPDQPTYIYDDEVQLTATADPGWTFTGWSGDLTGSVNPDNVTMDGDKTVTATFTQDEYILTVNTVGSGSVALVPDQPTYIYDDEV